MLLIEAVVVVDDDTDTLLTDVSVTMLDDLPDVVAASAPEHVHEQVLVLVASLHWSQVSTGAQVLSCWSLITVLQWRQTSLY